MPVVSPSDALLEEARLEVLGWFLVRYETQGVFNACAVLAPRSDILKSQKIMIICVVVLIEGGHGICWI